MESESKSPYRKTYDLSDLRDDDEVSVVLENDPNKLQDIRLVDRVFPEHEPTERPVQLRQFRKTGQRYVQLDAGFVDEDGKTQCRRGAYEDPNDPGAFEIGYGDML